ncbi:hypothetical protein [Salinibacillus xinjiangensis]|uniref:DUF8042 domain-containing protein n=1 Tax=Salinibacillus xinjiangensis TaxID=1229268 RepID=A0A6G1X1A5_9BACI|nr:hypothetical protein [Salinibacillus xinjiangensis]MRG84771.1 hypothetical protein [Salinibacillus xinjiangensis]
MENLSDSQVVFLQKYHQLLEGMDEALGYLKEMPDVNQSDIAETLFADLVKAMQQLHESHHQLTSLIEVNNLEQFDSLVQSMSKWFEPEEDKSRLLLDEVVPTFKEWKGKMDQRVEPYILH